MRACVWVWVCMCVCAAVYECANVWVPVPMLSVCLYTAAVTKIAIRIVHRQLIKAGVHGEKIQGK